jgi:hypothetical protein
VALPQSKICCQTLIKYITIINHLVCLRNNKHLSILVVEIRVGICSFHWTATSVDVELWRRYRNVGENSGDCCMSKRLFWFGVGLTCGIPTKYNCVQVVTAESARLLFDDHERHKFVQLDCNHRDVTQKRSLLLFLTSQF